MLMLALTLMLISGPFLLDISAVILPYLIIMSLMKTRLKRALIRHYNKERVFILNLSVPHSLGFQVFFSVAWEFFNHEEYQLS